VVIPFPISLISGIASSLCETFLLIDEFPHVDGLPTIPLPEYFNDETLYRTKFSKPLRLIHIEEGRRIRKATLEGTINPAKHYFSRSKNMYLQNL
jgi:hypothetical protein